MTKPTDYQAKLEVIMAASKKYTETVTQTLKPSPIVDQAFSRIQEGIWWSLRAIEDETQPEAPKPS